MTTLASSPLAIVRFHCTWTNFNPRGGVGGGGGGNKQRTNGEQPAINQLLRPGSNGQPNLNYASNKRRIAAVLLFSPPESHHAEAPTHTAGPHRRRAARPIHRPAHVLTQPHRRAPPRKPGQLRTARRQPHVLHHQSRPHSPTAAQSPRATPAMAPTSRPRSPGPKSPPQRSLSPSSPTIPTPPPAPGPTGSSGTFPPAPRSWPRTPPRSNSSTTAPARALTTSAASAMAAHVRRRAIPTATSSGSSPSTSASTSSPAPAAANWNAPWRRTSSPRPSGWAPTSVSNHRRPPLATTDPRKTFINAIHPPPRD